MSREIALIGGGHAHVEVIRRWGVNPLAETRLTVIDPNPRPVYSGMVPGFIAGQYKRDELEIDLRALCERAGANFVQCAASRIDAPNAQLHLETGATVTYDVASLDIGSTVAGVELPGVREFALPSRPIATLISEVGKLLEHAKSVTPRTRRVHVVGAGAGGVEVAVCLDARLRKECATAFEVALVTSDPVVLKNSTQRLRSRVERALQRRRIRTLPNSSVTAIREDAIELEQGISLVSSGAVWVTGPASHPLASNSSLPVDPRGFVQIRPTLQVVGQENLFAVGDCANLLGMRKAGVYAVRSGPLVDHNIRAHFLGGKLREYSPQDDFLSLLNLGDGTAIGTKWGVALEGRSLMWLKDRIDRSFMEKYR